MSVLGRRLVVALVLVLAVAGAVSWWQGTQPSTITVRASFPQAVGLYEGDDVRVLGVPVGSVTAVTPRGDHVEVEMEVETSTPVAADTHAVIVPPGVLASRYVQLTEPWLEGPRLADGAVLDDSRTAAPLELDDVTAQLDSFLAALGPGGVDEEGALAGIVDGSARALAGNGDVLRQTLRDVADALDTLGASRGDIVATIEQLQLFVSSLAGSDAAVRTFERGLADVSNQLASQRGQLRTTIGNVDATVRAVRQFVRANGENLTADIEKLARISVTLKDRERDLMEIADLGAIGLEGIFGAANLETGVLDARVDLTPLLAHPDTTLCQILQGLTLPQLCPASVPDPPGGTR